MLALTLCAFSSSIVAQPRRPLRVVEAIDLTQYAGRWYEIARLPNKPQPGQRRCDSDVVSRYLRREDGKFDIVMNCRTADGRLAESRAVARAIGDSRASARLQVRFGPAIFSFLPNAWVDHWIIGLGPDYTWAVVGTQSRDGVWIQSRLPEMSSGSYEQALEIVKGSGFDADRLTKTRQITH